MKNFILRFTACLFLTAVVYSKSAQGQYAYIPDLNFRGALAGIVPAAMKGDSLDITHTEVMSLHDLDVSSRNISDLTGIGYFYNLGTLYCSSNKLTAFPTLPASLTYLDCAGNQLTSLPDLPALLTYLNCAGNQLTNIFNLPNGLVTLFTENNLLTSLPNLPSSLKGLDCSQNELTSLPNLLGDLRQLFCYSNHLTNLPTLPASLNELYCYDNQLTTLPSLPTSLTYLDCRVNQLISLPTLPASLNELYCYDNQLTILPALPASLTYLDCRVNQLISLPSLPTSLAGLNCSDNRISCLPLLPESLTTLKGLNSGYTCLPNKPTGLISITGPSVLCDGYNSTCPNIYPRITGTAYRDNNLNLQQDAGETGHPNLMIQVQPGNYFFPATDTGYYLYVVDTGAAYTITPSALPYYTVIPSVQSTLAMSFFAVDSLNDFALQPVGTVNDLNVIITGMTQPRTGTNTIHTFTLSNNGNVNDTASLSYVHDPLLGYVSSSPPADAINGDTLVWNSIFLAPGQKRNYSVTLSVNSSIPLGTNLYSYVTANPVAGDITPADNAASLHQVAVGSYDPNDKAVEPAGGISVDEIAAGQWMDYTVRFQNTGNADALKVEIKDTLSNNLNLSTLQVLCSSHAMKWNVRHKIATFTFNNIHLPDSTSNEPESHGFVRYRVKANTNLTAGSTIANTSYIYFDNNAPVQTNTTLNTVCAPTAQSIAAAICTGDNYDFNGQLITQAGTYTDTIQSVWGCDSIITLLLSVNAPTVQAVNASICAGSSYNLNGQLLTQPGTYTDTIQNVSGCDSVITLHLTVNSVDTAVTLSGSTLQSSAVNAAYQWMDCTTGNIINGEASASFSPTASGNYAVIVTQNNCTDTSACNSICIPVHQNVNAGICWDGSYNFNGRLLNQAGTYTDTIQSVWGCDSVITLLLSVYKPDTTVTLSGNTLQSSAANTAWQWMSCITDKIINGATSSSYTPDAWGYYAVIVTQNNCTDTSACYLVTLTGIPGFSPVSNEIEIYPNPVSGEFTVSLNRNFGEKALLRIYNLLSQTVYEKLFTASLKVNVKEADLQKGMYLLEVVSENGSVKRKLLVE